MTTPEQLAKWREEFEAPARSLTEFTPELFEREPDCEYGNMYVESEWNGYLRRCQETEQVIKDAKHFKEILDVVYTRFKLKQTDKDFLFSFGIFEVHTSEVKEQELLK